MYDITFLGNAPVDVLLKVSDQTLKAHNFKKGAWHQVPPQMVLEILKASQGHTIMPGGSAANSAYSFANLGGKTALCAYVGDDKEGRIFYNAMKQSKVAMPPPVAEKRTLVIYVLITPDGERTFITPQSGQTLKPRALMGEAGVQEKNIMNSQWLFIEGYLFEDDFLAILKACRIARKHNTKIALTLAASSFVEAHFDKIALLIRDGIDLYVCNEDELNTLRKAELEGEDATHAQETLAKLRETPHLSTAGGDGATYFNMGNKTHVPTTPVEHVVDSTGAGDAFVAGYLYGLTQGYTLKDAITTGHNLAGKVVQQLGARLDKGSF